MDEQLIAFLNERFHEARRDVDTRVDAARSDFDQHLDAAQHRLETALDDRFEREGVFLSF